METAVHENLTPLIGEFAWHSLVEDPRIADESQRHFDLIMNVLQNYNLFRPEQLHILEIACYAHTTGYQLADKLGAQVTLFELSRHALQTGKHISKTPADSANPLLVSGDFHQLPFEDHSFNVVYICSALHHTWRYDQVVREMLRVLAPGGILFLENEPVKRDLCFYKFRCNRMHEFTGFEKKLDELGLLRTIAEPFLGSRPEMLFGMIENQTMSLMEILNQVGHDCDLLETSVFPESCMGAMEKNWFENRHIGQQALSNMIGQDITRRCHEAVAALGDAEQGMGFSLPNDQEIKEKAELISSKLTQIPINHELLDYRLKLAEIYGAPLQLTARKHLLDVHTKGHALAPESAQALHEVMLAKRERFEEQTYKFEGVYNSFPLEIREVLGQTSLVPDIQKAPLEEIKKTFSGQDWTTAQGDFELIAMENLEHQLLSLLNKNKISEISLPFKEISHGSFLFILRFFCHVPEQQFYKVSLTIGDDSFFEYNAYQSENVLCKELLNSEQLLENQGKIKITLSSLSKEQSNVDFKLAISYVGLFAVNALVSQTKH